MGALSKSRDLEWAEKMWRELLEPKSLRAAPGDRNLPLVDPGDSEEWEDVEVGDSVAELLRSSRAPGGLKALAT